LQPLDLPGLPLQTLRLLFVTLPSMEQKPLVEIGVCQMPFHQFTVMLGKSVVVLPPNQSVEPTPETAHRFLKANHGRGSPLRYGTSWSF